VSDSSGRPTNSRLLRQIFTDGYGTVQLDSGQAQALAGLYQSAIEFFSWDTSLKLRHSTSRRNVGYRTYGHAHGQTPDRPDLNDSFLYWPSTRAKLDHPEEIEPFLSRFEAYQSVVTQITRGLIDDLRAHYGYEPELPFENASFIQVNSFPREPERELLQDPHEDAVFLTIIWTSASGLELMLDGKPVAVTFEPDEVLVMPGSVLTDLTGGAIPPLFHQARNHGHESRKSIMYFASPEVDNPIEPFVVTDHNRDLDIRERIIKNPQDFFGLSEDFVTTA
jgi:isopenicillin N synthase-like dioxygenase